MSNAIVQIYLGTDHLLSIPSLTNGQTGEVITGADVSVTLLNAADAEVSGQVWPTTMEEDGTTPGRYACILSADLEITVAQALYAVVVADGGTGLKRTWYLPLHAAKGGF